jgi:hypothetical protein
MRNHILAAFAATPLALSACSTSTIPQAVTDIQTLDLGLQGAVTQFAVAGTVTPAQAAQARTLLAAVNTAASAVQGNVSPTATQTQQIVQTVNVLIAYIATVPGLPPALTAIFSSASILLPVIEAETGLTGVAAGGAPGDVGVARMRLRAAAQ